MRKYLIDTNLYIQAFRSSQAATDLKQFYTHSSPSIFLSSVVLHELLVGALNPKKLDEIQEEIAKPFRKTQRIITPSQEAWEAAGAAIAELGWRRKIDRTTVPKSFIHDTLIAASCRGSGVILVTDNRDDFTLLQSVLRFEFVAPWPS
jgi:predicted nucleic acid-binding protein